jgi:hypothetical protein
LKGYLTTFLFILTFGQLLAQKVIYKQWDGTWIDRISITSDALSTVNVVTSPHSVITLSASVEGELVEEIMINEAVVDRTLQLGTDLAPYFEPENDKLAAHKVLSVDMTIELPKGKSVIINSKYGSVRAMGAYEYFEVALENGSCQLRSFYGEARLYTINGNIDADALPGVGGRVESRYGSTSNQLPDNYRRRIEARSIYGNIRLSPSQ